MTDEHEALCKRLDEKAYVPVCRKAALAIRTLSEAPDAKDGEEWRIQARKLYWCAKVLLTELDAMKAAPWLTGALGVANAMTSLNAECSAIDDAALSGKESRE